jgi:hypothetical protein
MRIYLIVLFLAFLSMAANAEMQFPEYKSLSAEQQKSYGYTVNLSIVPGCSTLQVLIPPKAAKYCHDARLYIRDKQKKLLSEIQTGLIRGKDGSLSISIQLFSTFGDAELIIYTDDIPGAEYLGDFGGFSFNLTTKP